MMSCCHYCLVVKNGNAVIPQPDCNMVHPLEEPLIVVRKRDIESENFGIYSKQYEILKNNSVTLSSIFSLNTNIRFIKIKKYVFLVNTIKQDTNGLNDFRHSISFNPEIIYRLGFCY